jgi:hypothetical protein
MQQPKRSRQITGCRWRRREANSGSRLLYLSSGTGNHTIEELSEPVVIEAFVNGSGQVYDYRIVSGPSDAATRAQIEGLLLSSVFAPARFFGQPVRGVAVISFSGVSVRGVTVGGVVGWRRGESAEERTGVSPVLSCYSPFDSARIGRRESIQIPRRWHMYHSGCSRNWTMLS